MITVNVYPVGAIITSASPIASLSYSGRGKQVTITTDDIQVEKDLSAIIEQRLNLPQRGRAYPDDRQIWMESLPMAIGDLPFTFVITENELQEEEINDIEENAEEYIEEGDGDEADDPSDDEGDDEDGSDLN